MADTNLIGIANIRLGFLDLFRDTEDTDAVQIPRELRESKDPEQIAEWACRIGLIRRGEQIAISEN